jgi:mono/diheme cytochrome c family protein
VRQLPQALPRRGEIAPLCRRAAGLLGVLAIAVLSVPAAAQTTAPADSEAIARGAYVFRAAGCLSCHTDRKNKGQPLAGGRALATPFGTFYSPNITPDPATGIGRWTAEDFRRALREGLAPDGGNLFPAFPYSSYAGMTDQDISDLWEYFQEQPPVAQANRAHELSLPFRFRALVSVWKALFFSPRTFEADAGKDAVWNRGAYLVQVLGHCPECHTPRNLLGGLDTSRYLAGAAKGPDGKKVPNITPFPKSGIGDWRESDITYFLKTGFLPDGDVAGAAMAEVIDDGTSHLTDTDRAAIAAYLRALPPLPGP